MVLFLSALFAVGFFLMGLLCAKLVPRRQQIVRYIISMLIKLLDGGSLRKG